MVRGAMVRCPLERQSRCGVVGGHDHEVGAVVGDGLVEERRPELRRHPGFGAVEDHVMQSSAHVRHDLLRTTSRGITLIRNQGRIRAFPDVAAGTGTTGSYP
jgi:hypothetical protein